MNSWASSILGRRPETVVPAEPRHERVGCRDCEWYAEKYGEYATNRLGVKLLDLKPGSRFMAGVVRSRRQAR